MTLLEESLPIEKLNPVALAEGNAKKPVYRMHKWWARRLGSVFRTILLATFRPAVPGSGNEGVAESEGNGAGSGKAEPPAESSGELPAQSPTQFPTESPEQALWRDFCDGADLGGKIVLDPFMGGGTTMVEALRLGCKVVGLDINPVAWFVSSKQIEPVDLDALDAAFEQLESTAGAAIRAWYATTCPAGHAAEVMYVFWVKTASCAHCGEETRLFPNTELSRRDGAHVSCCPACLGLVETGDYNPHSECPHCLRVFDPRQGPAGRGRFTCDSCGEEQKLLDAVRRESGGREAGTPLTELPHALEGWCGDCGRFFKKMDAGDHALWKAAQKEFAAREHELPLPAQTIPTAGRSDPRPVNHGYSAYRQMFNPRQLLCLGMLLKEIMKLPERNVCELMLAAFSDCLDANTMFCKYEVAWHKISLLFGLHAYHPIERPTENNVWGTRLGRGTFSKCFRKVRKAKQFCEAPFERLPDGKGGRISKRTGAERIAGVAVADFSELLRTPSAALLRCQSAERMDFLPERSVDAVITDPPYFDNVQYAELADFFYVWLRQALHKSYPWFGPEHAGNPGEIVQNEKLGKDAKFFNAGLQQVFSECRRVLKDEGLLAFTFHHNKTWAWQGMAELLLDAGFYVSACPIVRSEGKSGFHSSAGNIKYDAVLVCRKREAAGQAMTEREITELAITERSTAMEEAILAGSVHWARRTLASGMTLSDADLFTILMGKTLEHYTGHIASRKGAKAPRRKAPAQGYREMLPPLLERMAEMVGEVRLRASSSPLTQRGKDAKGLSQIPSAGIPSLVAS